MVVNQQLIHRDEPIRRGSGKAHWCEELYRTGGEIVHVSSRYPNGLADKEYQKLIAQNPAGKKWNWRIMTRDAGVYVRGRISHPDHATIQLFGWHRVIMNTEHEAPAARNVVFLD
jgi:adenosyl cobinamide kinase/adenosyl cobinamide phosphate guanylyltransferase